MVSWVLTLFGPVWDDCIIKANATKDITAKKERKMDIEKLVIKRFEHIPLEHMI